MYEYISRIVGFLLSSLVRLDEYIVRIYSFLVLSLIKCYYSTNCAYKFCIISQMYVINSTEQTCKSCFATKLNVQDLLIRINNNKIKLKDPDWRETDYQQTLEFSVGKTK